MIKLTLPDRSQNSRSRAPRNLKAVNGPPKVYQGAASLTDLAGYIHTRPLKFTAPWSVVGKCIAQAAKRSPEQPDVGQHNALYRDFGYLGIENANDFGEFSYTCLSLVGVGPQSEGIAELLERVGLAYVGKGKDWLVVPLMSTGAAIARPTDDSQHDEQLALINELLAFILKSENLLGADIQFDPDFVPWGESGIVYGGNCAIDLYRTLESSKYSREGLVMEGKRPASLAANMIAIFEASALFEGALKYDSLAGDITIHHRLPWDHDDSKPCPRKWKDSDSVEAANWIQPEIKITKHHVNDALVTIAGKGGYNPVQDYLNTVKWDGKQRIGNHDKPTGPSWLATYFNSPNTPYARLVGRHFLMAMVARAYEPGCQVDTMFILEGPQGEYKSTGLKVLVSGCGADVHCNSPLVLEDKDRYRMTAGKWLYEIQEANGLIAKNSNEKLKTYLTEYSDVYVEKFETRARPHPRTCVLLGTVNVKKYLKDITGNRRYLFIECSKIDLDALKRDRDQLWAEAVHLYREGAAARAKSHKDVPIWARWWVDKHDAYLVVPEEAKRMLDNNEVDTDLLRDKLLGTDGYLVNDVKALVKHNLPLDRPYYCLDQGLAIEREYIAQDRKGYLYKQLDTLGFVRPSAKPYQRVDNKQRVHWYFVSKDHELLCRNLIAEIVKWSTVKGLEVWGHAAGKGEDVPALGTVLAVALEKAPTITDELRAAVDMMQGLEGTRQLMQSMFALLPRLADGMPMEVASVQSSADQDVEQEPGEPDPIEEIKSVPTRPGGAPILVRPKQAPPAAATTA